MMPARAAMLVLACLVGTPALAAARDRLGAPELGAALLVSPDSTVAVMARGPVAGVARSQAMMRRVVASAPCNCAAPDAWTFLQVIGAARPGALRLTDGRGRSYEPADPCAHGGRRSPFASPVALNFAFYGIRPDDVRAAEWRDSCGTTIELRRSGG